MPWQCFVDNGVNGGDYGSAHKNANVALDDDEHDDDDDDAGDDNGHAGDGHVDE